MSKRLIATIFLLLGFLIGAGLLWLTVGVVFRQQTSPPMTVSMDNIETGSSDQDDLRNLAIKITKYLKKKDFESLSAIIHPEYNLVFSPYATINLKAAKCFSADEIKDLAGDKTVYTWGVFDGTTQPIEMTFNEYYETFVFDRDYSMAPIISINNIMESGNALENIGDVFQDANFVEFHYPSSSGEKSDWGTLRLVFEKYSDTYALTAIVHSAWTA